MQSIREAGHCDVEWGCFVVMAEEEEMLEIRREAFLGDFLELFEDVSIPG